MPSLRGREAQPGDLVRSDYMGQGEFGLVVERLEAILAPHGVSADGTPVYPGALTILWYRPGAAPLLDGAPWYDDEVEVISTPSSEARSPGPLSPE